MLQPQDRDFTERWNPLTGARKGIMRENRYSKWDLLQSVLLFILSCLCSFLEHAKWTFFHLLYLNNDHERLAIIFPPLYVAHAYPHLVVGSDKRLSPGPRHDNDQVDESCETQTNVSPIVLGPTPPKARHRYIPLKLPKPFMISLQITMSTYLCSTKNLMSSQLKSTFKGLSIL